MTLNEFRKQYPQYNDVPDMELADQLYDKYYQDIDKNTYYKQLFPKIAEQKIEELESKMIPEVDGFIDPDSDLINQNLAQTLNLRPKTVDIARSADVGVNEGAPSTLNILKDARFAASLGFDEKNKQLAIKNVLSDLYKTDVDVRLGNRTGELEYLNPKTNKYELVNKPGVDLGDFTGLGGDAMVVIPDIAATIGATVFSGGNLPAGITAGAATAGLTEYSRYILGKQLYGINKDVSDKELLNRAFQAAGISAGSAILGVGAAKVIKGVSNVIKGRFIKADDIADAGRQKDIDAAQDVADSINNTLDKAKVGSRLKYSLAEATNNADLLSKQKAFETQNRLGRMDDFVDFKKDQAQALNDYFGFLKSGFNTSTGKTLNQFESGSLIQNVVAKRNEPVRQRLIIAQEEAENVLENAILNLPNGNKKQVGVTIRSAIDDIAEDYKLKVDAAAKSLDAAADMKFINTDIIKPALKQLTDKEKQNLLKVNRIESIFKDKALFEKDPIINKQLNFFENVIDENKIPIRTARNTLSSIKSIIRDKETGSATGEIPELGSLKFIVKNLEKQLRKDAPKAYIDELDRFNDIVINNKQLLNSDTISKMTLKKDGRLAFLDEDIFDMSFKSGDGSARAAVETFDVIKNYPDAMKAYKDMIYQKYKEDVIDTGLTKNKHNGFLKKFESPLKLFFNETEYKKIQPIGGLKKLVEDADKIRKETIRKLSKSFEGKLEEMTPGSLVNNIYKSNNLNDIIELKKILKNDPEVYKAFQRNVLSDMNESVKKFNSNLDLRFIDAKSFDRYLNGAGGERGYRSALREIFGDEYLENLNLLNKALQISARTMSARSEGFYGSAFSDIIRARLGQFTFAGRLFTAGRRLYKGTAERILANALLNPESLKELIRLRKLPSKSKERIAILSKLGGNLFINEEDDVLTPLRTDDLGN
jgi:hypothetical protein